MHARPQWMPWIDTEVLVKRDCFQGLCKEAGKCNVSAGCHAVGGSNSPIELASSNGECWRRHCVQEPRGESWKWTSSDGRVIEALVESPTRGQTTEVVLFSCCQVSLEFSSLAGGLGLRRTQYVVRSGTPVGSYEVPKYLFSSKTCVPSRTTCSSRCSASALKWVCLCSGCRVLRFLLG